MWSFRESPFVDGDKVVCTPGGEDATIVALDKATGETVWKSRVPEPPGGGTTGPGGLPGNRGGFGDFSLMQADPVLSALDADKSKEISAEEIEAAATTLVKLDANADSKLAQPGRLRLAIIRHDGPNARRAREHARRAAIVSPPRGCVPQDSCGCGSAFDMGGALRAACQDLDQSQRRSVSLLRLVPAA